MGGGLIQLEVYGSQDIFLTGTPQITFFKVVYRRHTNFAIESVHQELTGVTNFGYESSCVVDKLGDLMSKIYLEIELPEINLLKNNALNTLTEIDIIQNYNIFKELYQLTYDYVSANTDTVRSLLCLCRTSNITIKEIELLLEPKFLNLTVQSNKLKLFISTTNIILNKQSLTSEINQININIIFNSIIDNINREPLRLNLNGDLICRDVKIETIQVISHTLYSQIKSFYMKIYDEYVHHYNLYQKNLNKEYVERYKSAWVESVGYAIIDEINIEIGNETFDRQTGDFMIAVSKIYTPKYQIINLGQMIGFVPELITYDDQIKPRYKLTIPLFFWFCRNTGLALPLISLRYHDVIINFRLKDLSKLFYVEYNEHLIDLANVQAKYNINICSMRLWIDYIFLDSTERERFAQSTHEYLIEVVQYDNHYNINTQNYNARVTFAHPTKYMLWYVQPNSYRHNPTGSNKCQWNNYGLNLDKTCNPICYEYIRLNSYERTDLNNCPIYFNYVQPYECFIHSPTDGYNIYSFALNPTLHQPSSTCNMSRIDDVTINMKFTDRFMFEINNPPECIEPGAHFSCYTVAYTIMRIMSGMAGLAFETST